MSDEWVRADLHPACVYSARLILRRGAWHLSWHRRRLGLSRFWLAWPQLGRGIYSRVVLRADR